jgi:predicted acyltransferase
MPFVHVEWSDCRLSETIHPRFLFAVGSFIAIERDGAMQVVRILRRLIVVLYLLMNCPRCVVTFSICGTPADMDHLVPSVHSQIFLHLLLLVAAAATSSNRCKKIWL